MGIVPPHVVVFAAVPIVFDLVGRGLAFKLEIGDIATEGAVDAAVELRGPAAVDFLLHPVKQIVIRIKIPDDEAVGSFHRGIRSRFGDESRLERVFFLSRERRAFSSRVGASRNVAFGRPNINEIAVSVEFESGLVVFGRDHIPTVIDISVRIGESGLAVCAKKQSEHKTVKKKVSFLVICNLTFF